MHTSESAPQTKIQKNQIREIEAAGSAVDKRRVVAESISGSVSADQRPGFGKLLGRLEEGDVLAVRVVRVHCLALGGVDLTSVRLVV